MQVLTDRAAVAARVAPLGGITAESMRQATRLLERHVAALLQKVRKSARTSAARQLIAAEGLNAVGSVMLRPGIRDYCPGVCEPPAPTGWQGCRV